METATVQLPKDLIEAAIRSEVSTALVKAFGEHKVIIDRIVSSVLTQKVDREGKKSCGYNSDIEFVQWAAEDCLRKVVTEIMTAELVRYKTTIKENIIQQLSKKNSPLLKQLIESMTTGIITASESKWRINVTYDGKA